jgi:hypothetical protein
VNVSYGSFDLRDRFIRSASLLGRLAMWQLRKQTLPNIAGSPNGFWELLNPCPIFADLRLAIEKQITCKGGVSTKTRREDRRAVCKLHGVSYEARAIECYRWWVKILFRPQPHPNPSGFWLE